MRASTLSIVLWILVACGGTHDAPLKELQRVKSGPLDVVLLSPTDAIKQGKGAFVVEFRDASGALVDVGDVTVAASMPMTGMAPMFGDCVVTPSPTKGRYEVSSDLGMAGTWRVDIKWNGPAGQGSASLRATAS
jgi:hypothetical protein